jgi:hypothetical protein
MNTDRRKIMAARPRSIIAARLLVCLTLVSPAPIYASETWIQASSDHFQLFTSNNKDQAVQLLRQLETTRRRLLPVLYGASTAPENDDSCRVTVIAFHSDTEYASYRSNSAASAYSLEAPGSSYIVLGAASAHDPAIAVHEYIHHLLHRRYRGLPAWLDEGLAEVYSSLEERRNQLRLGLPADSRLSSLEHDGLLLGLPDLLNVKEDDLKKLRHSEPRSRFYSESWLLTHMLRFSPAYSPRFSAFITSIDSGNTAENAFLSVYRKTLPQVQDDLQRYLKKGRFPTQTVTLNIPALPAVEVYAAPAAAMEVQVTLANLLIDLGRFSKAEAALHTLQSDSPNNPAVLAAFSYLRLRQSALPAIR